MTKITKEEGHKIARMSHIGLHEQELQPLIDQLEQVLSYAERVAQVALVSSERSIKQVNVMRKDQAHSTATEPILACAPEREGNYFVVQAILDTK